MHCCKRRLVGLLVLFSFFLFFPSACQGGNFRGRKKGSKLESVRKGVKNTKHLSRPVIHAASSHLGDFNGKPTYVLRQHIMIRSSLLFLFRIASRSRLRSQSNRILKDHKDKSSAVMTRWFSREIALPTSTSICNDKYNFYFCYYYCITSLNNSWLISSIYRIIYNDFD